MARKDCMMERNIRIYRAYEHGVSQASLATLVGVSPERIRQIIHTVEHFLNRGDADYVTAYHTHLGN